jgi:tetratricopeptide (TPR) repeat protein
LVGLGLLAFFTVLKNPLGAVWYANLGAVQMARVELAGFPTGKWDDGSNITALEPAEALFIHALEFNPNNRTAHHRLGLIALLRQNFPVAVVHLEKAFQINKDHTGILKNLAYSYVWAGEIEKAVPLLIQLPEAQHEMQVYTQWWRMLGREDLAASAEQALAKLGEAKTMLSKN